MEPGPPAIAGGEAAGPPLVMTALRSFSHLSLRRREPLILGAYDNRRVVEELTARGVDVAIA